VAIKGIPHHQVEIKIDFAGKPERKGLPQSTPILDTAKQALSVPDISYSLESKDLALKMARSLLRNKIRKSLRGNSYLDLAALLKAKPPSPQCPAETATGLRTYSNGNIQELKLIGCFR